MATSRPPHGLRRRIDQSALLMMLDYVEAECRALGAEEAARHIALALALLNAMGDAEPPSLLNTAVGGHA
jgi:hypothetical protein